MGGPHGREENGEENEIMEKAIGQGVQESLQDSEERDVEMIPIEDVLSLVGELGRKYNTSIVVDQNKLQLVLQSVQEENGNEQPPFNSYAKGLRLIVAFLVQKPCSDKNDVVALLVFSAYCADSGLKNTIEEGLFEEYNRLTQGVIEGTKTAEEFEQWCTTNLVEHVDTLKDPDGVTTMDLTGFGGIVRCWYSPDNTLYDANGQGHSIWVLDNFSEILKEQGIYDEAVVTNERGELTRVALKHGWVRWHLGTGKHLFNVGDKTFLNNMKKAIEGLPIIDHFTVEIDDPTFSVLIDYDDYVDRGLERAIEDVPGRAKLVGSSNGTHPSRRRGLGRRAMNRAIKLHYRAFHKRMK